MELTSNNLIKIPPDERDKYYRFPYTGPYEGEPDTYEVMYRNEHREIWGKNRLAIHKTCPACGSDSVEWIRNQWAICYPCLLVFDCYERYIDLTVEEDMEHMDE